MTQQLDDQQRQAAALTEMDHPGWVILWAYHSRLYWAFPRFNAPPGTVIAAPNTRELTERMRTPNSLPRHPDQDAPRPAHLTAASASHAVPRHLGRDRYRPSLPNGAATMTDTSPDSPRPAADDDASHMQAAARLRRERPGWVIIWVSHKGCYRAWPLFRAPAGTTLSAQTPEDMAAQMDQTEQAARTRKR